jgi:DNA-binding NtrC family response regulator
LLTRRLPGNVRELRNAMHRAATFSSGPVVMPDELPPRLREANRAAALVAHASQQQLPLRARTCLRAGDRAPDRRKQVACGRDSGSPEDAVPKLAEYAQEPDASDEERALR